MDEIKVGDMVMWFEDNHTKKVGQVFGIDGDMADVYCEKESAVYRKPLNRLKKIR